MRSSSLIPRFLHHSSGEPGWLNTLVTKALLFASHGVCARPIQTIVAIALLASTTYIGLLEGTAINPVPQSERGYLDVGSLLDGGRSLLLSEQTGWKWQTENMEAANHQVQHPSLLRMLQSSFDY